VPTPWQIYDLLIEYASAPDPVEEVVIGPIWTLCRTERGIGLAMSPQIPTRVLDWSGTLCGRPVGELASWAKDFEPYKSTVGMAAINAAMADLAPPPESVPVSPGDRLPPNLSVFEHFLPELEGKSVAVIGRYPGMEALAERCRLTVLERNPGPGDLPDSACEYLLPEADWVFITASSLTNKTFPRLAELSRSARTVLVGPTLPWLAEFADYGIDYLAGIEVTDAEALRRTVAEGGGVRIFDTAVRYRIAELSAEHRLAWLKDRIATLFARKEYLTLSMSDWYKTHTRRFPQLAHLESVRRRLSCLDTAYKMLWDRQRDAP
jgi:uncharacterized protein (DUF4213/DUF364 family)